VEEAAVREEAAAVSAEAVWAAELASAEWLGTAILGWADSTFAATALLRSAD
jgi:hypothetical protein